jgi:hypothetical protein
LFGRIGLVTADTLAKAAKFVGIGGVPHLFVCGVPAELAVFKLLACCCVEDRTREMEWGGRTSSACGRFAMFRCMDGARSRWEAGVRSLCVVFPF